MSDRNSRRTRARLTVAFALTFVLSGTSPTWAADRPEAGKWTSLFDGKDLEGWTVKIKGSEAGDNFRDTFRVEAGVIKVSYEKYDDFGARYGLLVSNDAYENYRLRVEYRFLGDQCPGGPGWATRNSGVMIHSQSAESMRKDQDFPVSIEVQFLGGLGKGERATGNVCTPGTHIEVDGQLITKHITNSTAETYDGDQWVTMEVEAHGDRSIKHIVDGRVVLEYQKPQLDPKDPDAKRIIDEQGGSTALTKGHIALQAESHPIEFRKVEIMLLDD